jgi:uncharacterized protein YdeI (YjbR/CyaY-like superfamily)
MAHDDLARVEVASRAELHDWLAAHHGQSQSIWLVTWKAHQPERHVSYDDVVDEAIAFGWIDSLPRALDADRTMRRLSPRKPGSAWSAVNKARVARLIADGRMSPAGIQVVETAKADGSWERLDRVEEGVLPLDLLAALDAAPPARAHFEAFPRSTRRAILEWINAAKSPATRLRRVAETATQAQKNRRANQPRQRKAAVTA